MIKRDMDILIAKAKKRYDIQEEFKIEETIHPLIHVYDEYNKIIEKIEMKYVRISEGEEVYRIGYSRTLNTLFIGGGLVDPTVQKIMVRNNL